MQLRVNHIKRCIIQFANIVIERTAEVLVSKDRKTLPKRTKYSRWIMVRPSELLAEGYSWVERSRQW